MARKKSNNLNKRGGFLAIFGKSKKKSKKKSKREEKTSLKKKYSKICKKECKNKKYLGEWCDFNNNMCRWYDSDYNRDCNVENFYKQVNKEDLKKGVIIKKYAHPNGCSQGKGTKIKKL